MPKIDETAETQPIEAGNKQSDLRIVQIIIGRLDIADDSFKLIVDRKRHEYILIPQFIKNSKIG